MEGSDRHMMLSSKQHPKPHQVCLTSFERKCRQEGTTLHRLHPVLWLPQTGLLNRIHQRRLSHTHLMPSINSTTTDDCFNTAITQLLQAQLLTVGAIAIDVVCRACALARGRRVCTVRQRHDGLVHTARDHVFTK